jgi:lipid-A-disaccharide synthase
MCLRCLPAPAIAASRARAGWAVMQLQIVTGQSHTVLAACDVTLIASGTATLEAALFKRPMVIAYNMHWLSWQIMRRKQLQPWVGCPTSCAASSWCPSCCRTPPRRRRWREAVWLAGRPDARCSGCRVCSSALCAAPCLRRDTAQLATDAIQKVLAQLNRPAAWDRPAWWPAWTRPGAARWPGRWWRRP